MLSALLPRSGEATNRQRGGVARQTYDSKSALRSGDRDGVYYIVWLLLVFIIIYYQTRNHEGCVAAPLLDIIG